MNKGKVSQKAQEGRPHRNAGSHRLQGLTEGKAQHVKEGWVSQKAGSHIGQKAKLHM